MVKPEAQVMLPQEPFEKFHRLRRHGLLPGRKCRYRSQHREPVAHDIRNQYVLGQYHQYQCGRNVRGPGARDSPARAEASGRAPPQRLSAPSAVTSAAGQRRLKRKLKIQRRPRPPPPANAEFFLFRPNNQKTVPRRRICYSDLHLKTMKRHRFSVPLIA